MAQSDDVVVVLVTWPADVAGEGVAEALVTERLAACVSILPVMRSIYRWQGAVERADEVQLVIKTTRGRLDALEARVGALHPYEVPEFLVLAVDGGGRQYLEWVRAEVMPASG